MPFPIAGCGKARGKQLRGPRARAAVRNGVRSPAAPPAVRQRLTAVAALALLRRDRAPEFVDDSARVASDLVDVAFEMGCPQSRVAC